MFYNKRKIWMTAIAVIMATSPGAMANDPVLPETEMDAVVVTATRTENDLLKLPASATIMDAERIKEEGAESVADLLETIPGVDISGGEGYSQQPALRGLPESQTIIKVDGARENYVQKAGDPQSTILVDPDLLKAVEVVRGPSSTLHGAGGIGGVISMTTKDAADLLRPGQKLGAAVKTSAGSADSSKSSTLMTYGRTGDLDILASTSYRDYGSYYSSDPDSTKDKTRMSGERRQHFLKGSWVPDDVKRVSLSASRYEQEYKYPDEKTRYESDQNRFTGTFELNPSQWVDARLTLMHAKRNEDQINNVKDKLEFTSSGLDLQNAMRFATGSVKHRMVYGGDLYRDEYTPEVGFPGMGWTNPPGEGTDAGVFVQDEIALMDGKVIVTPALRYTWFERKGDRTQADDGSDSRLNPKLAVSFNPLESIGFYASYAEAFRAPLVSEMYTELDTMYGPMHVKVLANPDLKPETAKTKEIGMHVSRNGLIAKRDAFRFKAAYFLEDIEDLITIKTLKDIDPPQSFERVVQTVNLHSVEREGYELAASYGLGGFGASASYAKVENREGEEKDAWAGATPGVFRARLHYRFADTGVKMGWKGRFVESFDAEGDSYESYNIHGIFARWEVKNGPAEGLSAGIFVDNLLDEEYEAYHFKDSGPGMARNIKVSLGYRF